MVSKYTQKQVIDLINVFKGDQEFCSGDYPDMLKELKDFLSQQGFEFEKTDFLVLKSNINIDEDGYPYLMQAFIVAPISLIIEMTAYHHTEWDFYIDKAVDAKEYITKSYKK